ncbi:MAG: ComEC/Rec2 family competence protein, partial [Anaerolineales bacterium]
MLLPLFGISISFAFGIILASGVTLSLFTWLMLSASAAVLAVWWSVAARRRGWQPWGLSHAHQFLILLCAAAVFGGAARFQAGQPEKSPFSVAWFNDREYDLLVTGVVIAPPDVRDTYTNLVLQVEGVDNGDGRDLPVSGLVLARITRDETYQYGERLRLRGQLQTPGENDAFSYHDYLARSGIYSLMSNPGVTRLPWPGQVNPVLTALYSLKLRSQQQLYALFPDPEASLLVGILLGDETGIPPKLQQSFKNTGTAHIVAISGFNIAIIAGLMVALFSRLLGNRRGAVAAVLGIAAYTILVGADASVVRAALMGGLGIFARQVGRRQDAINTMTAVAAIMAAANPLILWDVGFQLSFGATLGLILYASPMQQWAEQTLTRILPAQKARAVAAPLAEYALFTLAAQITTLPIMAYHFERVSIVSLIINPLILPAQPPVMIASGLALLLSYLWFPLGQAAAALAWPFSLYTIRMVELFDKIPGGVLVAVCLVTIIVHK